MTRKRNFSVYKILKREEEEVVRNEIKKKKNLFLYGLGLGWESQVIPEPPNQSSSSSSPSF